MLLTNNISKIHSAIQKEGALKKKENEKKKLSWTEAIAEVLRNSQEPMHYTEIVDKIIQDKIRVKIGAAPSFTVNSILNKDIKTGKDSLFEKVLPGIFKLKSGQSPQQINEKIKKDIESEGNTEAEEIEEASGIIQALGMYWVRDNIMWASKPKLLGAEKGGVVKVDFSGQRGIYLLHDVTRVIYVGRTTENRLGSRLYEHTMDRFNGRWNRFSWFGTLAVDNNGTLVEKKSGTFSAEQCIIAMEAILIEGLEPPQNRQRGNEFNAVEFIQAEDPEIEKKKKRELLTSLGKSL